MLIFGCPKIMAQDPEMESIGSIGSILFAILEVQVYLGPHKGAVRAPLKGFRG